MCLQCIETRKHICRWFKRDRCVSCSTEDGYGWEKLFSERMCMHEDFGLETRVARYHNVYGPLGTFDEVERRRLQLYGKIISAKINNQSSIDIWGDGEQTRALYITDCIEGIKKLFHSNEQQVFNIGSESRFQLTKWLK